jgi:exodeoxyribonuclease VII small subunit
LKKNIKFEDALKRLEEIVDNLEIGVDELNKIVNLFEEGSELVRLCNSKLEKIENKIEIITKKLHESGTEDEE